MRFCHSTPSYGNVHPALLDGFGKCWLSDEKVWHEMWLYRSVQYFGKIPSISVWAEPQTGSTKDAGCITNLFISAPCFGSALQMSGLSFSSPAGTAEQTASLSQTWYPNKLSNLRCGVRFENVLKQILWRFLALWRDLCNRCVRASAAQNCHLRFDTVHFQLRFSWGRSLVLNRCL